MEQSKKPVHMVQDESVIKTIDCTPTWEEMTPAMVELIADPDISAGNAKNLTIEFLRMARIADKWIALQKELAALPPGGTCHIGNVFIQRINQ